MKFYIYVTRDKKLGCFNVPEFSKEDIDHKVEGSIRGIKLVSPSDISRVADHSLYYLGEYDDQEGKFNLLDHEQKLIDYEDYVPRKEGGD